MASILITGGSRGIGKAIAEYFSDSGDEVYAPGSTDLDVCDQASIRNYLSEIQNLDTLVLNAGVHEIYPIEDYLIEDFRRVMEVNLTGAFAVAQAALPLLRASQAEYKSIVMMSSISGLRGEAYSIAYSASKAALIGMTKTLALELAQDGIRVNAVSPGWVRTDMALEQLGSESQQNAALGASLQDRWIEPEEIASLVGYLCSDEARAITGQEIVIDAGLSL